MRHEHTPHAIELEDAATEATEFLESRQQQVADFDPKLMLQFELNKRVPDDEWRKAGLTVLDSSDQHVAVVFAADADLQLFKRRLGEYAEGPREREDPAPDEDTERAAKYEAFFDAIDHFRPIEATDRLSERLMAQLDESPSAPHSADVEYWFHSDPEVREGWIEEARARTEALGGQWVDDYVGERAGIALSRVVGTRSVIVGLAELDQVCLIDAVPEPRLEPAELAQLQEEESLPDVQAPDEDAPIVGLVDSGLLAGHPLLAPAVFDAIALDPAFGNQAEDGHGHGTGVAGVALYGDVLDTVRSASVVVPPFWIASVRVLDADGRPPTKNLVRLIAEAVEYLAGDLGSKVINLSFGDPGSPHRGGKSTPLAAELDALARRFDVLIVVSAGNIYYDEVVPAAQMFGNWPRYLFDDGFEIINPAQSAIAITVGSVADQDGLSTPASGSGLGLQAVAERGGPSPFTRHGPGLNRAIKPELVASGGNWVFDVGTGDQSPDFAVEVVTTSARFPDELFSTMAGTSMSAPMVANLAGRLVNLYPGVSANTLRALLVQGAAQSNRLFGPFDVFEDQESAAQTVCGYGVPSWERVSQSSDRRVVLYAEDRLRPDDFHVYRIPITGTFRDVGGPHHLTVSLAFDPPVRHRRFDYLGHQMEFLVVRGVSLEDVFEMASADVDDPGAGQLAGYEVVLRPTRTVRGRGTCQCATKSWERRPQERFHQDWFIVVRSLNKWLGPEADPERYSLAVALEVERAENLYAELEAEVELEIELEAQLRA